MGAQLFSAAVMIWCFIYFKLYAFGFCVLQLPLKEKIMKSQAQFCADVKLLDNVLDELINKAITTQNVTEVDKLEEQNLDLAKDPR